MQVKALDLSKAEITLLTHEDGQAASFQAELDGQIFEGDAVDEVVRDYITRDDKKARSNMENKVRSSINGWMSRATYRRKLAKLGLVREVRSDQRSRWEYE
jgi:hypothetical protein